MSRKKTVYCDKCGEKAEKMPSPPPETKKQLVEVMDFNFNHLFKCTPCNRIFFS